jgi:hypothetical protein
MSARQKILVAAVGLLSITLLFLFPLHWGSFTATHGPATALRAKRLGFLLLAVIACLAARFSTLAVALLSPQALLRFLPTDSPMPVLRPSCALRC